MNAVVALRLDDLKVIADEPRIQDLRVAERLGFAEPRIVRNIIRRHRGELETYGRILRQTDAQIKSQTVRKIGRGRPAVEYWLNEGQTLVVCMLARTPAAAAVRKEVIEVYMAYRRDELTPPADPYEPMVRRQAVIRQAVAFYVETKAPAFIESLSHLLTAHARNRRLPLFWGDLEVRQAVIALHRQMTIDEARAVLLDRFGPMRTPSRSAFGRFWRRLDEARGAHNPGRT